MTDAPQRVGRTATREDIAAVAACLASAFYDDPLWGHWVFPDDPFRALAPEIFLRDYYEPRLLPRLLDPEERRRMPRPRPLGDRASHARKRFLGCVRRRDPFGEMREDFLRHRALSVGHPVREALRRLCSK